jgi:hypothetical protein
LHAVTALRCTLSTGTQVLFRRCRLTKLSNVVAYACRSPHRKERHHVHSRRRFAGPSAYTASWLSRSHTASEALSARVIAGGEGGDPRLRGEGEVGCGVCERKHPAPTKHHLTLPLLRNGPHPLPRCAAERGFERDMPEGVAAKTGCANCANCANPTCVSRCDATTPRC